MVPIDATEESRVWDLWRRPHEAFALFVQGSNSASPADWWEARVLEEPVDLQMAWRFSYGILSEMSPLLSLSATKLDAELQKPTVIFFLTARTLNIIESDRALDPRTKAELMKNFHRYIYKPDFRIIGMGVDTTARLLENFNNVAKCFLTLRHKYQEIIARMLLRMGHGLSEFIGQPIVTLEDYDLFCHYSSGLVGVGLTKIMAISNLEDETIINDERLANSMALLLQKTSIIKNFHKHCQSGINRIPMEIYTKHAVLLSEFLEPSREPKARMFLNEMIGDAVKHVADCVEYMGQITNPSIFAFCAIPQIIAIQTLASSHGQACVLQGQLKLRKGLRAYLLSKVKTMSDFCAALATCFTELSAKLRDGETDEGEIILQRIHKARLSISENVGYSSNGPYYLALVLLVLSALYLVQMRGSSRGGHAGPFGEESLVLHSPFARWNLNSGDVVVIAGLWMFGLLLLLAGSLTRDSNPEFTFTPHGSTLNRGAR